MLLPPLTQLSPHFFLSRSSKRERERERERRASLSTRGTTTLVQVPFVVGMVGWLVGRLVGVHKLAALGLHL